MSDESLVAEGVPDRPSAGGPRDRALGSIEIEVAHRPRVNFAMQQNGVAIVEQITIANNSEHDFRELTVSASLPSDLAEPWLASIAGVAVGARYHLNTVGLSIAGQRLREQTERELTELHIAVTADDRTLARRALPLEVLPFDVWAGAATLPEMLAAFVTPNHPRLEPLFGRARALLGERTRSDALDGYQSRDPRRAAQIAESLFLAAREQGIGYINPPANFESDGQRVRLPDQILDAKLATCLDAALLLASLWEQSGLHPLIVLLEGHAFPALWTKQEQFAEPVVEGALPLRKRVELGEIVPVESTFLTHGGDGAFVDAIDAARRRLIDPSGQVWSVDIRSARKSRILPISQRAVRESPRTDAEASAATGDAHALDFTTEITPFEDSPREDGRVKSPSDRIERWKRKLLDLSLNNRLINFRETKRTAPLLCADLARLEDLLAEGKVVKLAPRPEAILRSDDARSTEGTATEAFLREELESLRVYVDLTEQEAARRLVEIHRDARASMEESGANLLHLAIGSLTWYESDSSEATRSAPLILVPAQLNRRAAGMGFTLQLADEPAKPNITLLQKLHSEFGVDDKWLGDVPEDEAGVDVPLILNRFRQAVRDKDRWEVKETAWLGLFSFNKYLMWRDIEEHSEDLRRSKTVRRLIDRDDDGRDDPPFPSAETLDDEVKPDDLLCTRDADSSQLVAVRSAALGQTYVLEGPPGTGKSQTIANIIADAVGRGRRVIFVAEKRAALQVVRKRLGQDGLGPYCLELHSNRASKKEVLSQLEEALNTVGEGDPPRWREALLELEAQRARLNRYVRDLHERRLTGESVHQVIGRLAVLGGGARFDLSLEDISSVDAETLSAFRESVKALAGAGEVVGHIPSHPLNGFGVSEYSFNLPQQAEESIGKLQGAHEALIGTIRSWIGAFLDLGADEAERVADAMTRFDFKWTVEAASLFAKPIGCPRELATASGWSQTRQALIQLIERGKARDATHAHLNSRYRSEMHKLDLLSALDRLKRSQRSQAWLRWLSTRAVRRQLRPYALGVLPDNPILIKDLERVMTALHEDEALRDPASEGARYFGVHWNTGRGDWTALEALLARADMLHRLLGNRPSEAMGDWERVRERTLALACEPEEHSREIKRLNALCRDLLQSVKAHRAARESLEQAMRLDKTIWPKDEDPGYGPAAHDRIRRWLDNLGLLNDWCHWRKTRDSAPAALRPLVHAMEEGAVSSKDAQGVFERSFGEPWLRATADQIESVRTFNARSHEQAVHRFRELDSELIGLTKRVLRARLASKTPEPADAVSDRSEMGILKRELGKKSRHMPTRRLIHELPHLLPRLKPCFLMSPLSVAQYLDPALPPFDLVVFDEASQIPVWDAIGALARGREAIVVGDSKQLPPTNFFNKIDDPEDEDAPLGEEDLESILQECAASGMASLRLLWHYRSQHESLITFSNYHYYENRLLTFPSAEENPEQLGVSLQHIPDGVYDRGGSRTNRCEAEAVVDKVVSILTDGACGSPPTVGVVTFNMAQQRLIEDLLDEQRRERKELEPFFTEVDEPVFVKNLENVQGDERDVILFSITYGPDQTGRRPSMHFGPLNGEGGERRLNVAVTRARQRVVVLSSIKAEDIDLARTKRRGVKDLKTFLDFAERGPRAIAEAIAPNSFGEFDSDFERAVHRALTERGWRVDTQVGCSSYRIDLAVKHPETPGRYLLGIECDGAAYHSAQTARDRDRLRQSVLEGLGWRIHRIWSTDWFMNPQRCLDNAEAAIHSALRGTPPAAPSEDARLLDHQTQRESMRLSSPPADAITTDSSPTPATHSSEPVPSEQTRMNSAGGVDVPKIYSPYTGHVRSRDREAFYEDANSADIIEALAEIVAWEAPVTPPVALRRLASLWSVERVTKRAEQRLNDILRMAIGRHRVQRLGDGLWPADAAPEVFTGFRAPGDLTESQRDIEEIPLIERVSAVVYTLQRQISLPTEDLEREAAALFGVRRVRQRARAAISQAIDRAIREGNAERHGDTIALPQT